MKKPSLTIIFLTVFIDLIGFGMVFPLLPIFAENLKASGAVIGALIASYSAMQFIFSPLWGRLSDRIGRRPVLLVSTACAAISYAVFALGSGMSGTTALAALFASRIVAGICGANITVAQAYIADITPPEQRSKKMGLIGMAFGLGFILGPFLSVLGLKWFGITGPGWIAAALCAANFLFALTRLPESWRPAVSPTEPRPRWDQFARALRTPQIGLLIGLFFVATFVFSSFETTIGLLVSGNFNLIIKDTSGVLAYDPKVVYLYAYCGLIGALVQGGAIGRMVTRFGEPAVILASLLLTAAGIAPLPWMTAAQFGWAGLLAALAVLSIGSNLTRPPVFGMISALAPSAEQGATLGVAQSAGSLARIAGPLVAASLYAQWSAAPFLLCAVFSLAAGGLAWARLRRMPA